jgi:uncharacterized protein YbjT (DUF2867 family)
MLAVMGATGNTGRATCEALLANGEMVTVVGRNLEKLADYARAGAELAIADALDSAALTKAFEGATAVYVMIGVDPTVADYDAHYDSISEATAFAILAAGVSHVVELSGIGSHLAPEVTKAMGAIDTGRRHEIRFNSVLTDVNVVHLRPGFFMENFLRDIPSIRERGKVYGPLTADKPIAMISTHDIGQRAADLLQNGNFSGTRAYDLLGPADLTPREATQELGRAIGVDNLEYVETSVDAFRESMIGHGVSESCAAAVAGIYEGYNSGRLVPENPRNADSSTPTTIAEFGVGFAHAYHATG